MNASCTKATIVTSAGVSAGIDLALWLAGQIGGDDRAKVIQLSMEYDPQPPFDCGHMSKASAKQKAAATALMAREIAKPAQLKAGTQLLWTTRCRPLGPRSPAARPAIASITAPGSSIETKVRAPGTSISFPLLNTAGQPPAQARFEHHDRRWPQTSVTGLVNRGSRVATSVRSVMAT